MIPREIRWRFHRRMIAMLIFLCLLGISSLLEGHLPEIYLAALGWLSLTGASISLFLFGVEIYRTKYNPLSILGAWGIRSPTVRGKWPQVVGITYMLFGLAWIGVITYELLKRLFETLR